MSTVIDEETLNKKLSDLTLRELLEYTTYAESRERIDAKEAELNQRYQELDEVARKAASLLPDVKMVGTPFEIKTEAEAREFVEQLIKAVKNNTTAVLVMGVK